MESAAPSSSFGRFFFPPVVVLFFFLVTFISSGVDALGAPSYSRTGYDSDGCQEGTTSSDWGSVRGTEGDFIGAVGGISPPRSIVKGTCGVGDALDKLGRLEGVLFLDDPPTG